MLLYWVLPGYLDQEKAVGPSAMQIKSESADALQAGTDGDGAQRAEKGGVSKVTLKLKKPVSLRAFFFALCMLLEQLQLRRRCES
ncbi:hypothetical protein BN2476_1450005 [Paraburkholderia piptadeniae]|uniref:Uncharacterized protein n=1 Tax=Paraburkholderia piptadeniae TaxID=1701573 RepID=A0A1N7SWK1_9BURK|nr:hypothetical protein BN2476_1450005 [Paraburkholderia piptadeniae]